MNSSISMSGPTWWLEMKVSTPRPDNVVPSSAPSPYSSAPSLDAPLPPFACSWQAGARNSAWVHVVGELDLATAPQLGQALGGAQRQARVVVLDLRELTFMDTSGVHLIIDAADDARQSGGRLMLVRPPPQIDRLLTLTGVADEVLTFDVDPGSRPEAHADTFRVLTLKWLWNRRGGRRRCT
jgi:anti-anti-sigma factor